MSVPAAAPILTADAMRAAEEASVAAGVSLAELMERAGAAVADMAWRMAAGAPILILCGPGNNGGDGYVAARLLAARGAAVRVAAIAPPTTGLARTARAAWNGPVEPLDTATAPAPLIVDALFGVGLTRPLADELAGLLAGFAGRRVLAVDVPSGVDADGVEEWQAPLPAQVTLALGALKPGHVLLPAAAQCGRVELAGIGIAPDPRIVTLPRWRPRPPRAGDHKYSRGMVLVRAAEMPGAARLAAAEALRAGAGYVVLSGAREAPLAAIVAEEDGALTERLNDARLGALVIGPGFSETDVLTLDVNAALASGKPLVVDAGAIRSAAPGLTHRDNPAPAIMTPHGGEFARAFPALQGSKIDRALAAARQTRAVVVFKGADTVIAAPDGRVAAGWPGCPWLATAGTGDVLAGVCGAMLAGGGDAFDAAVAAVGWHIARAQAIGPGLVADDLVRD